MDLAGQPFGSPDSRADTRVPLAQGIGDRGYAMAALLIAMSVMAVLMGALLPMWTTMATREKEAELVFRGNQYARAIGLFQRKFANTPPPTIDILVEQRFLRKKYKDPITNDDFQPLYANQAMMPGGPQGAQSGTSGIQGASGTQQARPSGQVMQSGFGPTGAAAAGGIIGVTSKSKETSLRVYNGRTRYNEWAFVHVQTSQRPGQPGPGAQRPGMPGAPNQPNMRPGPQGQPSPFGMPPSNQRQGLPMPPSPFGQPNRPPFPNSQFQPFPNPQQFPGGVNPNQQRPPGQRPPGQ